MSTIKKDEAGTRWIDVHSGQCTIRVLSFNSSHLRLAIESAHQGDCEIGVSPLIDAAAPAAKLLMDSYGADKSKQLMMDVSLSANPTLIKKWALFLKASPRWQNRPKQKNPWDTSEYKLIRELLEESQIFASYSPVTDKFPQFKEKSLRIEKVNYQTVSELPYFESELRAMGYAPQERLPIPLMVDLTLK